jgi:hypothetical protein
MCQGERGDEALVFKSTHFSLVTLHSQCTTEREDEVLMVKYSFLVTLHSQCTTGPLLVRISGRLFGLAIKADVSRARSLSLSGSEICSEKSNV